MSQWPEILEQLKLLVYTAPATLIAIIMHEMAHAWVSTWLGDPLPRMEGRLSPNPLKHLDPIGTICMLIFHFGWAKPVMVNPRYYKHPKQGMALTSIAGPAMNYLLAFIASGLYVWLFYHNYNAGAVSGVSAYFEEFMYYFMILNIGLGTFNLIPLPPLDGSKVFGALLPDKTYYTVMRYERYGAILLIVVLYTGVLSGFLSTVVNAVSRFFLGIWA
ncbi:MAG: site-2 protease family protein [Firmicutes bacterium]|nr:site-2 protease family protein [Bacillota bacterium]